LLALYDFVLIIGYCTVVWNSSLFQSGCASQNLYWIAFLAVTIKAAQSAINLFSRLQLILLFIQKPTTANVLSQQHWIQINAHWCFFPVLRKLLVKCTVDCDGTKVNLGELLNFLFSHICYAKSSSPFLNILPLLQHATTSCGLPILS